jgi:predicted secreted hydrolase
MTLSKKISLLLALVMFTLAIPILAKAETADSSAFKQVLPGYQYQFPRDFFSHDDFRIEWWYYTGHLEDDSDHQFGYQLTFFRVALEGTDKIENASKWKIDQIYFAHLAVSDLHEQKFYHFERINRQGVMNAGAKSDQLLVWNEDWVLVDGEQGHHMKAFEKGTGLDLKLTPVKPLVFHGTNGVSKKGSDEGNASHYFSYTRMKTEGRVFINGKSYQVHGLSWMDHEFSSNQLNSELAGWDWFSFQLNEGSEVMLYQLRKKDGSIDAFSSGSLIDSKNKSKHLQLKDFTVTVKDYWSSKKTSIRYPAAWLVTLPEENTRLTVTPDMKDQELSGLRSISGSYWEGSVTVKGTHQGQPVEGKGFVELVGYGKALRQELPE